MNARTLIIMLVASAGTAYACPGDSLTYSPNPGHPNFNPLHPDYDYDGDGIPNSEDDDIDGDGVPNCMDLDPTTRPPTENFEDGVPIWVDCPPWNPCLQEGDTPRGSCWSMAPNCDSDLDGIPNNQDDDDDDDGMNDINDPDHPSYDPTHPLSDPDCDGIPNFEDDDDDDDGIPDDEDENETCPDEGDPEPPDDDPGPPDPPDPPEPPDYEPPDEPTPPDIEPDPPEPPDPPTEPEPPGPDPDPIPPPPTDDECCEAICTRLDAVIMWLDLQSSQLQNVNENLGAYRSEMYGYMEDLMYDDHAYMRTIVNQGANLAAYLEVFREQNHDQTWYLQQLYERFFDANDGTDPEPPDEPSDYQFSSSTIQLSQLDQDHNTAMIEANQEFVLPDLEPYQPQEGAQAPVWDYEFTLPITNHPFSFTVDFAPIEPVVFLVRYAIIFIAGVHGIGIVMGVLLK